MRFTTPAPEVAISPWKRTVNAAWKDMTRRAQHFRSQAGRTSAFEAHLREARALLTETVPGSDTFWQSRSRRRAVVTVWAEDADLAERTLRSDVLDQAVPVDSPRSTLLTLVLARIYYQYFDDLDEWEPGLFALVGDRLALLAERTDPEGTHGVFVALAAHRPVALGDRAPSRIAQHVSDSGEPLTTYLERVGLSDYHSGRFITLVQQYTYLKRLEQSDPTVHHDFLRELTEGDLKKAPAEGRRMFGHLVVETMTTAEDIAPHDTWMNTIIDIAGDPRARGTAGWNTWWAQISEKSRSVVLRWLTTNDLRLFLTAVEQLGERTHNDDLTRMFPARKRLLEGLHQQNLIRETRLLAARQVRIDLRRELAGELRTEITQLKGAHPTLSVIYLDCGDFHVVEGSHDFSLHVFIGGPPAAFAEWSTAAIPVASMRTAAAGNHKIPHAAFRHPNNLQWIAQFLTFLADHGIHISPASVMDSDTLASVKRRFELPSGPRRTRS